MACEPQKPCLMLRSWWGAWPFVLAIVAISALLPQRRDSPVISPPALGFHQIPDTGRLMYPVAFRPDGRMLVARGDSLWSLPGGRCLAQFSSGEASVCSFAWSGDGSTLVAADYQGNVIFRDLSSNGVVNRRVHQRDFTVVETHPSQRLAASGGCDGMIGFWKLDVLDDPVLLQTGVGNCVDLAFHPGRPEIAILGSEGVEVWDCAGIPRWRQGLDRVERGNHIRYSDSGDLLYISKGKELVAYRTDTLEAVRRFEVGSNDFGFLDGALLYIDNSGKLNLEGAARPLPAPPENKRFTHMALAPAENFLLLDTGEGPEAYSLQDGSRTSSFQAQNTALAGVACLDDGLFLLGDKELVRLSTEKGARPSLTTVGPGGPRFAVSADGFSWATYSDGFRAGGQFGSFTVPIEFPNGPRTVRFSHDGQKICVYAPRALAASISANPEVYFGRADAGFVRAEAPGFGLIFDPWDRLLTVHQQKLWVVDEVSLQRVECLGAVPRNFRITHARFAPDGTQLVGSLSYDRLLVLEYPTLEVTASLPAGRSCIHARFAPDGGSLATYDYREQVVELWCTTSWTRLRTLPQAPFFGGLAFTPEGGLVTLSQDMVHFWDPSRGLKVGDLSFTRDFEGWTVTSVDGRFEITGEDTEPWIVRGTEFLRVRDLKRQPGLLSQLLSPQSFEFVHPGFVTTAPVATHVRPADSTSGDTGH